MLHSFKIISESYDVHINDPVQREVLTVHHAGRRGSRRAACNQLTRQIMYSWGQNLSVPQIFIQLHAPIY